MFVGRKTYDGIKAELSAELYKVRTDLTAAQMLVASQKSTLEWLMLRMTQLETERAKLLWTYLGVKVPVMEVAQEPPPTAFDNPLNALPNFNDMGDHEAKRQGIDWTDAGELTYGKV